MGEERKEMAPEITAAQEPAISPELIRRRRSAKTSKPASLSISTLPTGSARKQALRLLNWDAKKAFKAGIATTGIAALIATASRGAPPPLQIRRRLGRERFLSGSSASER